MRRMHIYMLSAVAALCPFPTDMAIAAAAGSSGSPGVFIYSRDVPTQPAQIFGEPAPPDQIILSGEGSPWEHALDPISIISDDEARIINAPLGIALRSGEQSLGHIESALAANPLSDGIGQTSAVNVGQIVAGALSPMQGAINSATSQIGAAIGHATSGGGD